MVTLLRRSLVLAALMFWQGGFTFYAAVVVPTGQDILGHFGQGQITRQVTWWLNVVGAIALVPLAWDLLAAQDRRRPWLRWASLVLMLATLVTLVALHQQLASLLDVKEATGSPIGRMFRPLHRIYLWVSTLQWAAAVLYAVLSLYAWRAEDRTVTESLVG
jgi:hypothetical protein